MALGDCQTRQGSLHVQTEPNLSGSTGQITSKHLRQAPPCPVSQVVARSNNWMLPTNPSVPNVYQPALKIAIPEVPRKGSFSNEKVKNSSHLANAIKRLSLQQHDDEDYMKPVHHAENFYEDPKSKEELNDYLVLQPHPQDLYEEPPVAVAIEETYIELNEAIYDEVPKIDDSCEDDGYMKMGDVKQKREREEVAMSNTKVAYQNMKKPEVVDYIEISTTTENSYLPMDAFNKLKKLKN